MGGAGDAALDQEQVTRPAVHFGPATGWLNDPLSPTWDGERYHLFFQHVPGTTAWAPDCHWGHATSTDLVTWSEQPVAIGPGEGDGGVWSGSVVARPGGGWRAFYTAVDVEAAALGRVRVADADTLDGPWVKGDVVVDTPRDLGATSFRDPFVERLDGPDAGWRMLVAASLDDADEGTAAVLSWSSTDLDTWTPDGVVVSRPSAEREPVWTGSLWECPQLIDVEGTDVLVGSMWHRDDLHHVIATPVERDGAGLVPAGWQQLTAGPGYYAPVAFRDADDQPCLMAWVRGYVDEAAGRAGVLSLPHRLALHGGRPVLRPHPAAAHLFTGPLDVSTTAAEVPVGDGVVRLSATGDGVAVEVAGTTTVLDAPPHDLHVTVDGPVVEVLTLGPALARVLAAAGSDGVPSPG